jgi:predicted transcriptional regulator
MAKKFVHVVKIPMKRGELLCPCQRKNCIAPDCMTSRALLPKPSVSSEDRARDLQERELSRWLNDQREPELLTKKEVPLQYLPKGEFLLVDRDGNPVD